MSLLKISTVSTWCPIRLLLVWIVGIDATAVISRFGLLSLLYLVTLLMGNGEIVLWEDSALECSLSTASVYGAKWTLDLCDAGCKRWVNDSDKIEHKLIDFRILSVFIIVSYKLFLLIIVVVIISIIVVVVAVVFATVRYALRNNNCETFNLIRKYTYLSIYINIFINMYIYQF